MGLAFTALMYFYQFIQALIPDFMEFDFDNAWVVDDFEEMKLVSGVNETDVLKCLLGLV